MQRFFDFNFFVSLFMCLTHTHTSTLFFSVVEVINRFLMLTRFGGGGGHFGVLSRLSLN